MFHVSHQSNDTVRCVASGKCPVHSGEHEDGKLSDTLGLL